MISKDLVLSQIPDHQNRTFYIFGPPKMVGAMVAICQAIGCASERIKAENFVGYE
jgi:ferredoxin-NADP reductase